MTLRHRTGSTNWIAVLGFLIAAQPTIHGTQSSDLRQSTDELVFEDDFESGAPFAWSAFTGYEPPIPANTTCATAVDLGIVTDFDGAGAIETSVTHQIIPTATSRWYKVLAEDLTGDDWKLLVKISNISAGANLDLYAYRRAEGNSCASSPAVPSGTCNQDISGCGGNQENSNRCSQNALSENECVSWFESCTGFLEDDQTLVWVEVRHAGGNAASFDLKIRNNGNNDSLTCATY